MPTRRSILIGLPALLLTGCVREEEVLASASRGSERTSFVETVGWLEAEGRTAAIAFIPFRLSDSERHQVIRGRGVYPAIERRVPMVELRLDFDIPRPSGPVVDVSALSTLQLTFWHFADSAAVVREERRDWEARETPSVFGLEGSLKPGGWMIGTVRGQKVVELALGNQSYTWNLGFQSSLS